MRKKWLFPVGALLLSAAMLTGCGGEEEDTETAPTSAPDEEVVDEPAEPTPDDEARENGSEVENKTLNKEEELQEQIHADPGIERAMVQVVESEDEKRVNADIVLTGDQDEPADEIADHYADIIKEKYPDYVVDIIIVRDGTQLTHKTYE